MELSVRKRITRLFEDTQRMQSLAGIDSQYSASDPEAGMVAPANAYEDDYAGLQKRFGSNIISKIEMFVEDNINEQLVSLGVQGTDILLKKSPPPIQQQNQKSNSLNSTEIFVRFGGYMVDARNYVFNVGYKDSLGEDIFVYRFVMDINGNFNNWQSVNFGS